MNIALIGFGEVGQTLADDLLSRESVAVTAWDVLFPIASSLPAVAAATRPVRRAHHVDDAVAGATLVISAVTAARTEEAARQVAGCIEPGCLYLDLNSASPGQKRAAADAIETAGGRYVEAAVMSPIAPKRSATSILLGGPHAAETLPVLTSLGFTGAQVFSDRLGAASAAKMCRSVIVKGLEALITESLLAARHYAVDDTVLASLGDLLPGPDWPKLARYMIARSIEHGVRRAEEMREVARTVADAGIDPWMSEACARRQDWAPAFRDALAETDLEPMLRAIRGEMDRRTS